MLDGRCLLGTNLKAFVCLEPGWLESFRYSLVSHFVCVGTSPKSPSGGTQDLKKQFCGKIFSGEECIRKASAHRESEVINNLYYNTLTYTALFKETQRERLSCSSVHTFKPSVGKIRLFSFALHFAVRASPLEHPPQPNQSIIIFKIFLACFNELYKKLMIITKKQKIFSSLR